MRAILNVFLCNMTSNYSVSGYILVISGQVAMKIIPLKVGTAESEKYRQHLQSKEPGLGLEQLAFISPKRASSSKA